MTTPSFYREQAARHQAEADDTPSVNVRDRALRAVDAWTKLADRAERNVAMREERNARSATDVDDDRN